MESANCSFRQASDILPYMKGTPDALVGAQNVAKAVVEGPKRADTERDKYVKGSRTGRLLQAATTVGGSAVALMTMHPAVATVTVAPEIAGFLRGAAQGIRDGRGDFKAIAERQKLIGEAVESNIPMPTQNHRWFRGPSTAKNYLQELTQYFTDSKTEHASRDFVAPITQLAEMLDKGGLIGEGKVVQAQNTLRTLFRLDGGVSHREALILLLNKQVEALSREEPGLRKEVETTEGSEFQEIQKSEEAASRKAIQREEYEARKKLALKEEIFREISQNKKSAP